MPCRTISNTFNKRNPNIILITQTGDLNLHLATKILQFVAKRWPSDFFNISSPAFSCKMVAIKNKTLKGRTLHEILHKGLMHRTAHFQHFTLLLQVYTFMRGEKSKTGDAAACTIDSSAIMNIQ